MNEPNGLIGLRMDYVRPEDAGTYSLIVSNALGEITGTAKVEVEERERRPEFVASLQPQTVVEGFPVKMEVKTIGKPAPELKWLRNDEEVSIIFICITEIIEHYYKCSPLDSLKSIFIKITSVKYTFRLFRTTST